MGQKGHLMDQKKGEKCMKKGKKIEFSNLKYLLFSGIFLSGIGGYPPPPFTENHPAQKPLAEMGGTPFQFKKHICLWDIFAFTFCRDFGIFNIFWLIISINAHQKVYTIQGEIPVVFSLRNYE